MLSYSSRLPTPDSRLPTPDSRLPTPDSLGALSVGELNSPRVAPLPTPDSLIRSALCYMSYPVEFNLREI
ncbi:hypothetical protein [Moorena sp. SIO4G3]|uniref:hypothetical protein n=1 Tax=Moorena sp. SIO4G3 TaxID=2607821 RepID=UPI00142B95FC|nr:hypothetical protein [Moorena sp. SIO4G3]NEO79190.1 hypothetical protein [Moorena sp. SIO4G3]